MKSIISAIKQQINRLIAYSHTITPNHYDSLVMQCLGGF